MARLVRSRLPAATVIMLGVFPRHWGGEFNAEDAWPNPLAKVPRYRLGLELGFMLGFGFVFPSQL